MKFCSHCGNQLHDEAVLCPKCGCAVNGAQVSVAVPAAPSKRYCHTCGAEVLPAAIVCPKCGCALKAQSRAAGTSNGLQTAAKVLMIISCVILGFYLIPLFWTIPMTCRYSKAIKNGQPVSTGFKVCTLLFVNVIAGILMLCDQQQQA